MIGFLEGKVVHCLDNKCLIMTSGGVGYYVSIANLKENMTQNLFLRIFISSVIRENSVDFYGFFCWEEYFLFENLIAVKGVGPKSAFHIINNLAVETITSAIITNQRKIFTSISGVGEKTASQIVLDLQSKMPAINKKMSQYKMGCYEINSDVEDNDKNLKPLSKSKNQLKATEENKKKETKSMMEIMEEALMGLKSLGLNEDYTLPIINKILEENSSQTSSSLVQSVLKNRNIQG
jgi:Holliday junction DNA helicase RuvA